MNIIEAIRKRKSCRSFNSVTINPDNKKILENFIFENRTLLNGEVINLFIIDKKNEDKKMKLDYGAIKGHQTYILGTSLSTKYSKINYGYLMEKVVLKATEMGISTCWIGYFDKTYFSGINIESLHEIPGILIIGYPDEKPSFADKLVRFSINASKRHSWDKLFFKSNSNSPLTPADLNGYADSVEMVRLAPSSGNTQPWRVYYDEELKEFHFYKKTINKKYEEVGMHYIDLGIAMAHFELTSIQNRLSGSWKMVSEDKIKQVEDLEYIITWKCN
jgi:nitroreductase